MGGTDLRVKHRTPDHVKTIPRQSTIAKAKEDFERIVVTVQHNPSLVGVDLTMGWNHIRGGGRATETFNSLPGILGS